MNQRMLQCVAGWSVALACTATTWAGYDISVSWVSPVGGETLSSGSQVTLTWDAVATGPGFNDVSRRDVLVSFDNGASWEPLAVAFYFGTSVDWFVKNKPTTQLVFQIRVEDFFGNRAEATTAPITLISDTPGALVPTTDRDFEAPGTQPIGVVRPNGDIVPHLDISSQDECLPCHGQYDPAVAINDKWWGSMMAHASIDPLFKAALEINDRVAPGSGDICLRCHVQNGWLKGRSNPSDGSALMHEDLEGVSCELCHRMVDPIYDALENPIEDQQILADLEFVPSAIGNAMLVVDPNQEADGSIFVRRRGPFANHEALHDVLVSPYHQEAALCGTCHNVGNPALDLQAGSYGAPNAFDQAHPTLDPTQIMSEQRTYSEWFFSAFNTPQGVYAPEFGGNRDYVATCQDCHMRDATGRGCFLETAPLRQDMPLHDMTGANPWMLSVLDQVDPTVVEPIGFVDGQPVELGALWIQDGINRSRYMLQNAAELTVDAKGAELQVRVTNKTGHKLPTGYPEGRRMWLNVQFYDASDQLISESAAYDPQTGVLTHDAEAKIYEAEVVIDPVLASIVGLPAGTKFYLALSNQWVKDNRIPPLGFSNAAYETFGAAPVGATYADGQNWDDTTYAIPQGAARAEVRLLYQMTSKEYVEFLRDNGSPGGPGQFMYDLWANNDKAPPELMEYASFQLGLVGDMNCDGVVSVSDIGPFVLALTDPAGYEAQFPNCNLYYGDVNQDTFVTVSDIGPFVALLTGG